jgi:NTP pyrophosphatase (non-canonical NTP hydrolase)
MALSFNEYEELASQTAIYPGRGKNISYPALGLCGEAGEVAEKIKKSIRDNGGILTDQMRVETAKELGDVLWYIAALSHELNLSLEMVASMNLEKLASRKNRNMISGNGDNR